MSIVGKRIGGKITEIRLLQKLTQAQLAEKINVSPESISRLERGVNIPSLKTLEKISDSLDTKLKEFFEFDGYGYQSKDKSYERELCKLMACLRRLDEKEIKLIHQILKLVFKKLGEETERKNYGK